MYLLEKSGDEIQVRLRRKWTYTGVVVECPSNGRIILRLGTGKTFPLLCDDTFWHCHNAKHDIETINMFRELEKSKIINRKIKVNVKDGAAISYEEKD